MIKSDPFFPIPTSHEHIGQRRERAYKAKAQYMDDIRNIELINRKLFTHKKVVLPQLQTNDLKKNFNSLLASCQKDGYSPVRRYEHPQLSDKQTRNFYNQAEIYAARIQKISSRRDISKETIENQKKIGKSFSETKRIFHLEQPQAENLVTLPRPGRAHKVMTEQSSTSTSSKQIYQRLNRLKYKDQIVISKHPQQNKQKDHLKEYKHSNFVLKFKVAQSHHFEKSQLRTIKNSRNDNPSNNLIENIKIKNYTKFFSNDIDLSK